jgi:predicted transcriptional regulator
MSKTEVYSWRLDPELKQRLDDAARAEKTSLGALLDRIARAWLADRRPDEDEETIERQIRTEAAKWIGSIRGSDPTRSLRAKEIVRERIRARRPAAQRPD